jgi:hypothetical protein
MTPIDSKLGDAVVAAFTGTSPFEWGGRLVPRRPSLERGRRCLLQQGLLVEGAADQLQAERQAVLIGAAGTWGARQTSSCTPHCITARQTPIKGNAH